VFEDLGYPDAAERQAKLRLAYALNRVLERRQLSQAEAAKVLESRSRRCLQCATTSWRASRLKS
jgi:predicted XRE-type DNA-binding protein